MSDSQRHVECTIPVLPVRDLLRSIEFYTATLGFQLDWGGQPGSKVCSVSRDSCAIMLSQDFQNAGGTWVWIGVADDSLFQDYRSRGVKVRQKAANYTWAYEMKFEDIDGNILWLGTEPRKDLPLIDLRAD
ncbi:MAG: VOC family protein [Pirellulales bacterium]